MKSNLKKICLLLVLCVIPFMTTGCGQNSSAKSVAVDMVTRLSKDNYKNIGDIFYQDEQSYFDEEAFKEIIQDKELNISGNKTIKVKEIGGEITDQTTGNTKVEVKIQIDDNKIFTVDTIKVKNKWYVYEPRFYDGSLEISVPKGSTVKFNGTKLGKKYVKTKKIDIKSNYPGYSYRYVELDDVEMDIYTIKNVLKGKYNVSVKSNNSSEVKDIVYTYSESSKTSDNYTRKVDYSDKTVEYAFKLSSDDKEIKNYVNDYLDNIYKNAASAGFEGVEKYFDKDMEDFNTIKTNYEKLAKKCKSEGNSIYYSDFEIDKLDYKGIAYYDENHIVATFEYTLKYKSNYSSSSSNRTTTMRTILALKKDSKNKYVIIDAYSPFSY